MRPRLIETLARLGEGRPAVAWPPLRARQGQRRRHGVAAASGFCALAKKNAAASAPSWHRREGRPRRRPHRGRRVSGRPRAGGPKAAARLVGRSWPGRRSHAVRAAAADALGTVSAEAAALVLFFFFFFFFLTLLDLMADGDPQVRATPRRVREGCAWPAGRQTLCRSGEGAGGRASSRAAPPNAELGCVFTAAAKAGLWGLLRQAARDGDEAVRLEAVRAAGASKGPGLEVVRGAVDNQSQAVRAEAMRLLAGGAGGGARDALPTFEAMLHGADAPARTAAVAGIGELPDAGEAGVRLLGEALAQRSEALRAAAARALGRLAEREPARVAPIPGTRGARCLLRRAQRGPARAGAGLVAAPGCARSWDASSSALTRTASGASSRWRRWSRSRNGKARRPLTGPRRAPSWIGSATPARRSPAWRRASARASSTRRPPRCTRSSNVCSAVSGSVYQK